jgi:integrase
MTTRRSRGEGGLHWDEGRQRWIATATLGFDARGKRITRKASGTTKTAAKQKLKEILRDHDDGLAAARNNYTVTEAVRYWLAYGLNGRSATTADNYKGLAEQHIVPALGARRLRDLSAEDVDRWLKTKSKTLSTRSLRLIHSILNRAVKHAQARDKVKRNVVALCDVPTGQDGRPSKSMSLEQAEAVLTAAEHSPLHAYIVLSLLIGARTEELRALTWDDVDTEGQPPSISVLRSVRVGGDTKTRRSRRRLRMPLRCVEALRLHRVRQATTRAKAGARWDESLLVFTSAIGTPLDAHNVRRSFRAVVAAAGLVATDWTPREMRHSFVSLLSDSGVPIEHISRLVGHSGTVVTETVYRQQLRPVMEEGATAMDRIFPSSSAGA